MKRDFNRFLLRHGGLQRIDEHMVNIRNLEVPVRTYKYTGSIPEELPTSLDELTEFEKRFINEFEKYCIFIISIITTFRVANGENRISEDNFWTSPEGFVNKINPWGFNAIQIFRDLYPIYSNIVGQERPHQYVREEIEKLTQKNINHTKTILATAHGITANMLRELLPQLDLLSSGLQQRPALFPDTAILIRNALISPNPTVIFKKDFSRVVVFTYKRMGAIVKVKKEIKDHSSTHRIACFQEKEKKFLLKGLYTITIESPEKLENSLGKFLRNIQKFLLG